MSESKYANTENFLNQPSKRQTDYRLHESQVDYESFSVPENYSVTNWEQDSSVLQSFETLTDYLSEDRGMGSYLIDQATTGQDTDPAEFMRDLTMRLGAPLSLAKSLKDAPENVKAAFRNMKSKWDKASLTGAGEYMGAVKDYGADVLFSPEGVATVAGVLSGGFTFGATSAATVAGRKAAQLTASKALMDAVRATAAATTKNPLKAASLVGSIHGGVGTHLAQEVDISADIKSEEDYSMGENLFGTAAGAVLGPAIVKGFGLMGKGGKLARDYFSEGTRPTKPIPLKEAEEAFNSAVDAEDIPQSGAKLVEQLQLKLDGDETPKGLKGVWKPVPKQGELDFGDDINTAIDTFVEDLGGGEATRKEVQQAIRAAADSETVSGKRNKLIQGLYTVSSNISGNIFGKAAGVLSPLTSISGTAKQLQMKLSHEFGIEYKTQGKIVEKDLSEVQREITGNYNERFRAIVDGLSLSELDTKLAEDVNSALSLSLRSVKPIQHANFDGNVNASINQAATEIKSLYKEMGVKLNDIEVIDKLVDNYVPRMWKRSAIENNPTKLIDLFVTKAGMSKAEARRTVDSMLDIKNQVDQGTAGGYFFSSKRKIETIGNDADFEEFLNNDVLGSLHAYTYQTGKSLAKHRVLGVNNFQQFDKFYVNRIREEVEKSGETFTPKMQRNIEKLYRSSTGEGLERYGRTGQNIVDGYSFANRVGLLGLATLSSLTEVMLNISKSGVRNSVKGFGDAMKQSHKTITKDLETKLQTEHGLTAKEALAEMRSFSIHVDQALAQVGDRLAGDELVHEGLQTASNKFFRLTLLDQWTKFVQSVSFSSGKNLINDNIVKLSSYGSEPLDRAGETLAGELAELGIDYSKAVKWHNAGSKTDDAFYKSDILGGAARYTNSVVLQPTALSGLKPLLYSNPKTAVLFQLLSYPVAFTNTVMKGAAKQLIKNPKRNAGKIAAAGTIMTGMARWTNYLRTGGENERGKDTDEIIYSSIARWGGNGILVDSLQRARTAAKYSGSNLAYATLPFGPAASDALSLIQQGIIPTVGNKVPFISGSYFGKQILGEHEVLDYRRSLKTKQEEVFGGLIPEFEETPSAPGFYTGGVVAAARAASKPIAQLFSKEVAEEAPKVFANKADRIVKETDNIFNTETIDNAFNKMDETLTDLQLEGHISLDSYNLDDFAEAAVVSELRKKFKPLSELEANADWVKAMKSGAAAAPENWRGAQESMGYNNDEIIAFKTIEELKDDVDPDFLIRDVVAMNMQTIKNTHDKLNIKITEADIEKASKVKFDEDSLNATHQFLTQVIDSTESMVSLEGASKIARNAIVKLAADGDIDFSKFKAPKISKMQEDDGALDSSNQAANIEKYVANSQKKDIVYRAIQTFKDREFNVAFTFPREMGTHVGTKGVAKTIKLRNMLFDLYDGDKAGDKYKAFKNKKPDQLNYNKEFESLERLGKAADYEFEDTIIQQGYIDVKNPLVYKGETAEGKWAAEEILASEEGLKELIENINLSGVKVTSKLEKKLNALSERAKNIKVQPKETMLEKIKAELKGYELTTDLRTELQGMGFDSIKYKNEIEFGFKGESESSYILFEPNQFKLTTATKFDANDSRHAFNIGGAVAKVLAPKLASGFFSKAQKEALNLQQKSGTGDVMLKRLEDKGVSKEELEWTGAKERFEGKSEVSREEVQEHFEDVEFDLDVKEGRYTDRSAYKRDESDLDLPEDTFEMTRDDEFWEWVEDNRPLDLDMIDEGVISGDEFDSWYSTARSEWEGGSSALDEPDFDVVPMHLDFAFEGRDTKNYRELPIVLPQKFKKSEKDFIHAHFPTLKNPIAHVRLADVEPVKGDSKVLLIDEIQSDVHQMGRDAVVPDLPFKKEKKWGLLGLKKAMMEAAEGGYDEVALTTGSLQGIRNRQISKIDNVQLQEFKSGVNRISFYDKEGNIYKIISNQEDGYNAYGENYINEAARIIGKENVDKLFAQPVFRTENQREFIQSGPGKMKVLEDLEIEKGGEKMKQFYDKTLMKLLKTNFADKYNVDIKVKEIKQNEDVVKLPVLKITEQMRKDILKGLPMFAEGGEVDEDAIIQKAESVAQEEPVVAVSNQLTKGSTITALKANLNKGE